MADEPRLKLDDLAKWLEQQSGSSLDVEEVRDIVIDLLTGGNYRSSTETYTKEQILIHAAWLLHLVYQFKQYYGQEWQKKLFEAAFAFPLSSKAGDLMHWLLGLGKKTRQNLGLTKQQLPGYLESIFAQCQTLAVEHTEDWPEINMDLLIGDQSVRLDYDEVLWLLAVAGAVTLSLRGSAKSYWGNRIEKAFLRTALTLLGLTENEDFWLDVRGDEEGALWRQVDAEVRTSKDARRENRIPIEYGLIGEGNPEISADKMGRVGQRSGIVIVDKLRRDSRAYRNAVQEGAIIIVLRDNPHVLRQLYESLNGRCLKPLTKPSENSQDIQQAVRGLPDDFFAD